MTSTSKRVCTLAVTALLCALACAGCGIGSEAARPTQQATPVSTFDMLNQYGEWFTIPVLGEVWRPREAYGWQPYNNGRWIWTDRGWMWAGYEPYAWIVYHYGNWTYDDVSGWVWIPSYEWSPAPVRWVTTDAYVGWAPLPPPGVSLLEFDQDPQMRIWTMVPVQSFVRDDVGKYRTRTAPSRSGTRIMGDIRRGPDAQEVGRLANQRIDPVRLETEKVRSGNRQLEKVKVSSGDRPVDESSGSRSVQPSTTPPAVQQPPAQPVLPPAMQQGRRLERPIEKPEKQVQPAPTPTPTPPPPAGVHGRQPGAAGDTRGEAKKVEKKTEKQEKPKKVVPPKKEDKDKEKPKERKEER